MQSALFLLLSLALFVLQGVVAKAIVPWPDVLGLLIGYLVLERPLVLGAFFALSVGYLADVFMGTPRGLLAGSAVWTFFLLRLVVARIAGGHVLLVMGTAVGASCLLALFAVLIEWLFGLGEATAANTVGALPVILVQAALLSYPVYRLFSAVDKRFAEPEDEFGSGS